MDETLLFWVILFAFLLFDNIQIVAKGKDFLSINRKGKPYYKSRKRNAFNGRDVVFLNPFNLLDAIISVERVTLIEVPNHYKKELRSIQSLTRDLNPFVYLGYLYFLYLGLNCYLSILFGFESVVFSLLLGHISFWFFALVFVFLLLGHHNLPKGKVFSILFEALFVPAYLINLNKKFLGLKNSNICALRFHVRSIKRVDPDSVDLVRYELISQINDALDAEIDFSKTEILQGFIKCLKV